MKYCTNCGKPIEENDAFCQNCGTKATAQPDNNQAIPKKEENELPQIIENQNDSLAVKEPQAYQTQHDLAVNAELVDSTQQRALRECAGSQTCLLIAIFSTAVIAMTLIYDVYIGNVIYEISTSFSTFFYFPTYSMQMCFVISSLSSIAISSIFCIGVWRIYFWATKKDHLYGRSFTILRFSSILNLILACISTIVFFIIYAFLIIAINVVVADYELIISINLSFALLLLLYIVIFTIMIIYYSKVVSTIYGMSKVAKNGSYRKKPSLYVIVMNYICFVIYVLTLIFSSISLFTAYTSKETYSLLSQFFAYAIAFPESAIMAKLLTAFAAPPTYIKILILSITAVGTITTLLIAISLSSYRKKIIICNDIANKGV